MVCFSLELRSGTSTEFNHAGHIVRGEHLSLSEYEFSLHERRPRCLQAFKHFMLETSLNFRSHGLRPTIIICSPFFHMKRENQIVQPAEWKYLVQDNLLDNDVFGSIPDCTTYPRNDMEFLNKEGFFPNLFSTKSWEMRHFGRPYSVLSFFHGLIKFELRKSDLESYWNRIVLVFDKRTCTEIFYRQIKVSCCH